MEKKEVNRLIKGLLTDQLSWEEKEKLSHAGEKESYRRECLHGKDCRH